MYKTIESERKDSIELTRNAKGEYAYKAKIYCDFDAEDSEDNIGSVIDRLVVIDEQIKEKFIN